MNRPSREKFDCRRYPGALTLAAWESPRGFDLPRSAGWRHRNRTPPWSRHYWSRRWLAGWPHHKSSRSTDPRLRSTNCPTRCNSRDCGYRRRNTCTGRRDSGSGSGCLCRYLAAKCQDMVVGFALRKSIAPTTRQISLQKPQVSSLSVFAAKSDVLQASTGANDLRTLQVTTMS